jgi:hypothetical protein
VDVVISNNGIIVMMTVIIMAVTNEMDISPL